MSYESPIEMFTETVSNHWSEKVDDLVMKAVMNVGIEVDKDELVKALAYDRDQYEKGFHDGMMENKWVPTSGRPPENEDPVYITWVNRNPEPYYKHLKDVPFTAIGRYRGGKWWQEYLDEYGMTNLDAIDESIEVTAWMPLPEPYEEGEKGNTGAQLSC